MSNYSPYYSILEEALMKLDHWRSSYGEYEIHSSPLQESTDKIIEQLTERLKENYPFHHPSYAGQMLKPPHPIAWLAYSLTMTINPNNHALDGGPPTSEMEKEVMDQLAEMVGYSDPYLGHLTGGGTAANLEALFIARELSPGKKIAATTNAHYTHQRMCRLLNVPFLDVPVHSDLTPDFTFLDQHREEIGTLVVTMGTTGLGTIEPLHKLLDWASEHQIRIHLDAAYGGFFTLIRNQLPSVNAWNRMHEADSIVIDPHKHGLQPYGCGSVLFKDPSVGRFYKHHSPYTYFTSDDLHLGEISLECSRAGASAAALWATLKLLPLNQKGLGSILEATRNAAFDFYKELLTSTRLEPFNNPDLDIVAYFPIPDLSTTSEVSRLSKKVFDAGMSDKENGFFLSLYKISADHFIYRFPEYQADTNEVTILRSVFMKPEHELFIENLLSRLHVILQNIHST